MPRTGRTRALPIQEREDSSSITVSAPPFKRPRGRPPKNPLQSKKSRTAPSYQISDPAIVSTSKPIITTPSSNSKRASRSAAPASHTASDSIHKLGKKRKRTLSEDVCPTDLQTVCDGCRQRSYHSENLDETPVILCYKCKKGWHALCMAKSLDVPGPWECCKCSRDGNPPPSQPAHTEDTQADVMAVDRQAQGAANKIGPSVLGLGSNVVTDELYMPRLTEAQNDYREARSRLSKVLSEREACEEHFYKFKGEIERVGHQLEEHRRHFHSDGDAPSDAESQLSITQLQLVLEISGDRDWTDKVSAKFDLIKAEEARLTKLARSLQEDVKIKKAALKGAKQQRSRYSTCLETSCRVIEKLRSIITIDFEEISAEDSDSDLATDTGGCKTARSANADISPNGIVVLRYTPATELARALEQIGKADESEIQGSFQPLETDRVPEQSGSFNAAEATQEPQDLPQTLEPDKAPEQSDTTNKTSPQEAISQPSDITIHMPFTSDLIEGRNQQQNVSLATSIPQEPDQPCTPEDSCSAQDAHPVTFVSIPAASAPSSGDSDRPRRSLTPENTSIITGDRNSEEPHSYRPVLDGMALSAENQDNADVVINQRPEHQSSRHAETDLTSMSASYETLSRTKPQPPFLGLTSSASPASPVHNKVVLPPITSFSPTHDALQSSALPSITPQTHLRTSISSNTLGQCGQYATNGDLQTPVRELTVSEAGTRKHVFTGRFWRPSPSFQERITCLLVNGIDDTEIPTPAGVIYRRDLRTLIPQVGNLNDMIINEYLKCLAQYTNARRESNIPDSCNKICIIGSTDCIPPGLLKSLVTFSALYVPIKWDTHWILAVLYPGSLGRQGLVEVYDSHWHWANNSMTANDVFRFLKSRLGDEFNSGDWAASVQQRSLPERSDADSGLYVLANAKSIALTLGMVDLDSRAQSLS